MSKLVLALVFASIVFLFGCTSSNQHIQTTASGQEMNDSSMVQPEPAIQDSSISQDAPFFRRFTKAEYEAAKAEGKAIWLSFHANWCPTCQRQNPINEEVFASNEMPRNVAAFEVHFNDGEANADDEQMAREFNVVYQHTQFVLDTAGNQIHKSTGFIFREKIFDLMKEAAGA